MSIEERSDLAGKPVFDSNGQQIATVERVVQGTPIVEPTDDIDATASITLGWEYQDDPCRLGTVFIDSVSDRGIHLKSNL